MRYLLFFILFSGHKLAYTQYFSGVKVIDSIEESKFYFVGQLHCNQANTIIEKELLFALNSKYRVQYNVLEYGQSVALFINEYLKTGQDSFLTYISPTATFSFIKAVKAYNDSIKEDRKIKFYGLDFENRNEGKFTRHAIQLIAERTIIPVNNPLFQLLHVIITAEPQEMEVRLKKLQVYLTDNQEECRSLLKDYFLDLFLIVNAQYHFSPNRDDAMVKNFNRLYSELRLIKENPCFFASFGTGHINPLNSKGIAMRLLKDNSSPVASKVSVIGVQYLNSAFYKDSVLKPSDGNLSFLSKNATSVLQSAVAFSSSPTISFISKRTLANLNFDKAVKTFSGMLVIQNYDKAALCDWQ